MGRSYLKLITVLIVELKWTRVNSLSVFSFYLFNKTFTAIWYLKLLISVYKSSNKSSIIALLAVNWTDGSCESITSML